MSALFVSSILAPASLFPWLVALGVGGTAILLVALAACGIRRPPARSRVSVWRAAVIALLALPLLSALAWTGVIPSLEGPSGLVHFELPVQPAVTHAAGVDGRAAAERTPTGIGSVPAAGGAGARRSNETGGRDGVGLGSLLAGGAAGLWIAGAAVLALRLLGGLLALARHRRSARPVRSELLAWACRQLPAKGPTKTLRILRGGPLAVPVCWGLRHATILLPTGSQCWEEERTHATLLHELSHVRAGDAAFLVATRLAVALHWFNPLAWILQRLLDRAAEEVCDEMVLEAGVSARSYARALVETAREASRRKRRGVLVAMAHRGGLERRIEHILAGPRAPVRSSAGLIGAVAILVVTVVATLVAAPLPETANSPAAGQAGADADTRAEADTVSRAEIVEALVGALDDTAPEVRRSAVNSLRDVGDPAGLEAVEALLEDPDDDVRHAAEAVLGLRPAAPNLVLQSPSPVRQPPEGALDSIAALLSSPEFRTRLSAARSLGNLANARSTTALVGALDDEDPRVREAVARALGHVGDPTAVPPLLDAWPDADDHVRAGIVSALGELGERAAAGVVIEALDDDERHVRRTAAEALGKLGRAATDEPDTAPTIVPAAPTVPEAPADTAATHPLASHTTTSIREAGLAPPPDVCRDRPDTDEAPPDLVAAITMLLEEPDPQLRERAAWSIGALSPSPEDVEGLEKDHHHALIVGLSDPAPGVRVAAACGLGKLGDERALEFLTLRSQDSEPDALRRAARWAIDMIAARSG